MIKQMMKLAGARNQKEFLKMFPTEASFLKKHGGELFAMYGGTFANGGMAPGMMQDSEQGPGEQGVSEQSEGEQGGGGQEQMMQQIVQFIVQSLQQGATPEQILQKLVQQGIPQEQATQLLQAVIQKIQEQSQQGGAQQQMPQQGMAMGGVTPQEEGLENQPVMRTGGTPCYMCGGKYATGGNTESGTYSAGVYYGRGGAYLPDYSQMAMGGSFDNPGFKALPAAIQAKIMKASGKAMHGGSLSSYQKGGEYELNQQEIDNLIKQGYKIQYV